MAKFKVGDRVVFKFKSKKESVTDRKYGWLRGMDAVFKLSYITIDKILPSTFHSKINGESFTFDEHDFILYKEEEKMEYKINGFTFGDIYKKVADLECEDAFKEWNAFVGDCLNKKYWIQTNYPISKTIYEEMIYNNPKRLRFALKHGFVEKIEKETYELGDIFIHDDTGIRFQLIGIGKNKICLSKLEIKYTTNSVEVQDMNSITEDELQQLSIDKFKKVK